MSAVRELSPRGRVPVIAGAPAAYNDALAGGYLMFPHLWMQQLLNRGRANPNQLAVILILAMRTISAARAPGEPAVEWAVVKMAEFARALDMTERGAQRILDDLIERELIACQKRGRDMAYRLLPENWKAAPPYQQRTGPVKKPVESEDGAAATVAAGEQVAALRGHKPETLVVLPGKESVPIALGQAVRRIQWKSFCSEPLQLAWEYAGGTLSVGFGRADTGTHVPVSSAAQFPARAASVKQTNTGTYVPVSAQPIENERLLLLEGCLLPLHVRHFGPDKPLPAALLAEILEHLGGAPVEVFIKAVSERLRRKMANPRHLLNVADESAEHYRNLQKHNDIAERERAEYEAERMAFHLETARGRWRRGEADAAERLEDLRLWPHLADEFPSV